MKLRKFSRTFHIAGGDVVAHLDKGPNGEPLVHVFFLDESVFYHMLFCCGTPEIAIDLLNQLDAEKMDTLVVKAIEAKKSGQPGVDLGMNIGMKVEGEQEIKEKNKVVYTCQADDAFPMEKALAVSKKNREAYADVINLREHVSDLLVKLEREGFDGIFLKTEREYFNVPALEGGWRACYATFFVKPDYKKSKEDILKTTEVHVFFNSLGKWFKKRLPKGISINVHEDTGQFEIFDPVRMEQENKKG